MENKITREQIKNIVEYCIEDTEESNKGVEELIIRLHVEFNDQWKMCRDKYKKVTKK